VAPVSAPVEKAQLILTYDVTGLTREEIDCLAMEAAVQAESSERHGDVPEPTAEVRRLMNWPDFYDKVEMAWWERMQGELTLEGGGEIADLVRSMTTAARSNIDQVGAGVVQAGPDGEPLPDNEVDAKELARRVAGGLALLFYGGAA